MEQKKWKSPVVWASFIGQIIQILLIVDAVSVEQVKVINLLVAAILEFMVGFGFFNNPDKKDEF